MILTLKRSLLRCISLTLCLLILAPVMTTYAQPIDLSFRFAVAVDWQESGYRLAISSSGDKSISIVSNPSQNVAVLDTGIIDASNLDWSADGHQLAAAISGGPAKTFVQIWNTDPNVTSFALSQSLSTVALTDLLRWSPDGTILGKRREAVLASASGKGIEIWDADSGEKIKDLDSEGSLLDLAWKPDGTQIAAPSGLGVLRVWDVATGALLLEKQESSFYASVAWQPDGNLLAVYNIQNQTFEFWDVAQQQMMFTRHGSGQTVRDEEHIVWGTGGFASFDRDNRIKIWDIQSGSIIGTIETGGYIEHVEWSPDGTQLFYAATTQGGIQDAVHIVSVAEITATPTNTPPLLTPTLPITSNQSADLNLARWNSQQDIIAATDGYTITFYDSNLQLIRQIVVVSDSNLVVHSTALDWSPDGSKLAVIIYGLSFDVTGNVAQIWDVASSKMLTQIPNVSSQAGLAWSPDSTQIAVVYSAGNAQDTIHIYNAQNGILVGQFPSIPELRNISLLAWCPNEGQIVGSQIAFEQQGYVQIWDAFKHQFITMLPNPIDNEVDLAYSPNDSHLAFVDLDTPSDILIWDTSTFRLIRRLHGHTNRVYNFIWGSGGIVSNSFDQTTRVWNPNSGETISILQTGILLLLNWNHLGTLFLAENDTNGIHIRDARTGDVLADLLIALSDTPTPILSSK